MEKEVHQNLPQEQAEAGQSVANGTHAGLASFADGSCADKVKAADHVAVTFLPTEAPGKGPPAASASAASSTSSAGGNPEAPACTSGLGSDADDRGTVATAAAVAGGSVGGGGGGGGDVDLDAQLAGVEGEGARVAPFFRPYWSAASFITALGAVLMIWMFAWLYCGAFWNPVTRLSNLHVAVLNCDSLPPADSVAPGFEPVMNAMLPLPLATSMLAGSVFNASSGLSGSGRALSWYQYYCGPQAGNGSAGSGPNPNATCGAAEASCLEDLRDQVLNGGKPWAVVYFPSGFTTAYLSWFPNSGVAPAQQRPLGQYIIARGRDYSTYTYVGGVVQQGVIPGLSRSLTAGLAGNGTSSPVLARFLALGFALAEVDLAPVRNFGQHFATYIFCVLLWLGASFVVATSWQFKLPSEVELHDPALAVPGCRPRRMALLAWGLWVKGSIGALFMFLLMLLLTCVLWGLGGGNEQWAGANAGEAIAFGWFMSWSFISVNAVLLHLMGIERFSSASAFLLILQLTSSSAILSSDLSNRFFYIGKGFPFYWGVRGFRHIFFNALNETYWLSWVVLLGYNLVCMPLALWVVVRRVWANSLAAQAHRHQQDLEKQASASAGGGRRGSGAKEAGGTGAGEGPDAGAGKGAVAVVVRRRPAQGPAQGPGHVIGRPGAVAMTGQVAIPTVVAAV
ncbi:hypothetical protein HYH02_002587 [Chlamydomonas schloesseri]|uniref:DUF3533 domain-containing protein n=1 Tax=Chlamydomonas schloesseri TaxID=2026947 RepID=A0A836BBX5_9CHLO|nr:hypothetical protein HYH02_002587 [Chlamydomonas schloesseri]|eukprot:KAG2453264.1 hypothetical protein HYH02_002587 [Chlamydomonas schloesseri]